MTTVSPLSTVTYPLKSGVCSSCGAAMLWATGANGRPIPLNAGPRPDGNIWLSRDGRAHYRSKANPIPEGADRYSSHFSDCPNAANHRRKP